MKAKTLKTDFWILTLKRAFGRRFFCAVLLISLTFFLDTDIGARNILLEKYAPQGYESVLFYLYPLLLYGNNYKLYLVIMTVGFVMSIPEEWKNGMTPYIVKGIGSQKYAIGQIIIAAVSGGVSVAAGFLLYLLWMTIKLPLIPDNLTVNEIYSYLVSMPWFEELSFVAAKKFYVYRAIIFFLSGATWTALAAGVSVWLKNRYFVIIFPYLLYRGYVELSKVLCIPNNFRIDRWYAGLVQPFPPSICLIIFVVFGLLVMMAASVFFCKSLKWRLEDGWN